MTDIAQIPPPPPTLTLEQPAVPRQALSSQTVTRIWCAFTALLCFGMLGLGLYLTPSPDGFGKHQGLFGMPPCGFYAVTGYPCPTCGCTTAVSHFAHGQILASFLTQPFGFAVALVAFLAGTLALIGLITGKWLGPSMFKLQWYWRVWVFGGIGILLFGWAYKAFVIRMGGQ